MKDVKINISTAGFPSQFVSDAEKATEEYGLMVGQAIQYEVPKKSDRLNRSLSARASRKKSKAIKKIKTVKQEKESLQIFNKGTGS